MNTTTTIDRLFLFKSIFINVHMAQCVRGPSVALSSLIAVKSRLLLARQELTIVGSNPPQLCF